MDILTLAQLNKLKKSGGVGYTTKEVLLDGVFEWGETFSIMTNITDIKVGDTVKVTWDGVEYTCVAYEFDNGEGMMITAFGNTTMGGYGEDNGVPFVHVIMPNENGDLTGGFVPVSDDVTGSVSIKVSTEIVHTIDPKYLPSGVGGGLPVVDFETAPTPEGAILSENDMEKLKALNGAMPFIGAFYILPVPLRMLMQGLCVTNGSTLEILAGGEVNLPEYGVFAIHLKNTGNQIRMYIVGVTDNG